MDAFTSLAVQQARRQRKLRRVRGPGYAYLCFTDDYRKIPRGTVIDRRGVLWGYPHIGRILSLEAGLAEHFPGSFRVEEKVDGYNVRVARLGDHVLAFTRGGVVCPFTNDRLSDLMDLSIFDSEPDLVVCAEVAGPDNPYVAAEIPSVKEDVALQVFDFMRLGHKGFVSHEERDALVARYGLRPVRNLGYFTSEERGRLRECIEDLDRLGCEGVVIKDARRPQRRAKYVTASASLNDIRQTAQALMDNEAEYYTNRILRLALYLLDHNQPVDDELRRALGGALLDPLLAVMADCQHHRRVGTVYRCRFRQRANAQAFMAFLRRSGGRHAQVREIGLARESGSGYWLLRFERTAVRLSGLLDHLFSGGLVYDP